MSTMKNLNNVHLSAEQTNQCEEALATLEQALQGKMVNLSPDERRKYGSIGETNKLLVNKVYDYALAQPGLCCQDVDWDEFKSDYLSRMQLEGMIARLQNMLTGLNNAKTLHDYDNYHAALDDYSYTVFKAGTAVPGYETKLQDIKQFFYRSSPKKPETKS